MDAKDTGDKLTLSHAVTLNQEHLITIDIFAVSSQSLASSVRKYNCGHYNQNIPLHCQ